MILTEKEEQQFDRVLEIVTYGNDGKPHFPEEAVQLLEELAASGRVGSRLPENERKGAGQAPDTRLDRKTECSRRIHTSDGENMRSTYGACTGNDSDFMGPTDSGKAAERKAVKSL